MLKVDNLTVTAGDKIILENLNLEINPGEIKVLMGKNGSGKSSLCKALLSHPDYKKKKGKILFDGKDITKLKTNEIASLGIYYLMQNPTEVEGVTNAEYIKKARETLGIKESVFELNKELNNIINELEIEKKYIHHEINVGLSGGEKKKSELFGMYALKPKLILLDEFDSGLDVDSLKHLSSSINKYVKENNASVLIITHHTNILDYIIPDEVNVLFNKKIILTGDASLAEKIEKQGFSWTFNMVRSEENE